jgi:hypothetical protein
MAKARRNAGMRMRAWGMIGAAQFDDDAPHAGQHAIACVLAFDAVPGVDARVGQRVLVEFVLPRQDRESRLKRPAPTLSVPFPDNAVIHPTDFILDGDRRGVLLVHGLTGTPMEMRLLARV